MSLGLTCRAAAKAGRAVLHLDPSSHYGSAWGSFTTEQLIDWAQQAVQQQTVFEQQASEQLAHERAPEATTASSDDSGALYSNVQLYQQQEDLGPSRQYNIDLAAKASKAC